MFYRDVVKRNNLVAYQIIKNAYERKKISHAFLFVAPKNFEIINEPSFLIQTLISDDPFFKNNLRDIYTYADLQIIDGSRELIKKEMVVSAIDRLQQSAIEKKGKKILWIKNLEHANKHSLNSLLKFLEEPTKNTHIIMSTNNKRQILSTILSRSQIISLRSPDFDSATQNILEMGVDKKYAPLVAALVSEPAQTYDIFNDDFKALYQKLIDIFMEALSNKNVFYNQLMHVIDKENHILVFNMLRFFYSDIWRHEEGVSLHFNEHELLDKYFLSKFNYQKALYDIDDYFIMQDYHVNFELYKSQLLIKLGQCYG